MEYIIIIIIIFMWIFIIGSWCYRNGYDNGVEASRKELDQRISTIKDPTLHATVQKIFARKLS